ncbi:hypothetical protein N7530_002653 [Penicillium desertorum]|jgi:hypothetical protein|uniref:Uncharacterized protein n=1 Tax=Penicillium desertorum TaxID=1303715 RepID=A0A9W9X3X3_9EURO|nr:hypothetical protein N7530_002653 [Penicillium desertorum]
MSLITDVTLMGLWEKAQMQSSSERASVRLWTQLWAKHLFSGKDWVVSQERPPEGSGRRLGDITIEYLGEDKGLTVLAFHKVKPPYAGPQDVEEAEGQAFDACMRYLGEHPALQYVYAFISFGTKVRGWRCARDDHHLFPLFGSKALAERTQYVEVHSSEAQLIKQAVQMMRALPPTL